MPTPSDAVATHVATLERALVGSSAARAAAAREIEADLREAVAARIEGGADAEEAARIVCAEFGEPQAIAADLSHELLVETGQRYAPVTAAAAGGLFVLWGTGMAALASMPGFTVAADAQWLHPFSRAFDVLWPGLVLAGGAAWAWMRHSGRLAALVTLAAMQTVFALVALVAMAGMAAGVTVPAGGAAIFVVLVGGTALASIALALRSVAVLSRAVRLHRVR